MGTDNKNDREDWVPENPQNELYEEISVALPVCVLIIGVFLIAIAAAIFIVTK